MTSTDDVHYAECMSVCGFLGAIESASTDGNGLPACKKTFLFSV